MTVHRSTPRAIGDADVRAPGVPTAINAYQRLVRSPPVRRCPPPAPDEVDTSTLS
jgi:hypothetical protein